MVAGAVGGVVGVAPGAAVPGCAKDGVGSIKALQKAAIRAAREHVAIATSRGGEVAIIKARSAFRAVLRAVCAHWNFTN